jgi:hypothetical protein
MGCSPLSTEAGAATTTGTVTGASVTDQLGQTAGQLGPYADTIDVVKYLLLDIEAAPIRSSWPGC